MFSPHARVAAAAGIAAPALLLASAAAAQPQPTLGELALQWARGDYRAPIVCLLDDQPRRVARRVLIRPVRRTSHRAADEVVFFPLDLPEPGAPRCLTELGGAEPDVQGRLRISLPGRERPDVARMDFTQALKRKGGFEFEILSGRLRVRRPAAETAQQIEFAGGRARFVGLVGTSDHGRLLREFGPLPKRTLTLEAKDGTRLTFRLVQIGQR